MGPADAALHALRSGADWREPDWHGADDHASATPHEGTWRETRTAPAVRRSRAPGSGSRSRAVPAACSSSSSATTSRPRGWVRRRCRARRDRSRPGRRLARAVRGATSMSRTRSRSATRASGRSCPDGRCARGGLHRRRRPRRRRAVAVPQVPERAPPAAVPARRDVQLQRRRRGPISTGAKDDMDHDTVVAVAAVARRPRRRDVHPRRRVAGAVGRLAARLAAVPGAALGRDATSKFKPRFRDATFAAVREAIAPMRLGLWMTPMFFNPSAATFKAHPEWACQPIATALVALNLAQPDSGSNEAGLGAVESGRARARRDADPRRRSSSGTSSTSSSTSSRGSIACRAGCTTCTTCTTRSSRCSTACRPTTRR